MLIPIGTDVRTPRVPYGNYALIAANVLVFVFTDYLSGAAGSELGGYLKAYYALDAARPSLHQYVTYQFLHGDILHLAGNMLFLWIFGNAVCDRMGSLGYVLFYLAGGVCAGCAFTTGAENPLVGASGSIAAVTTAFLALFPRVHITMLVWMFVIFTIQVPAMIVIVFKIILWDNIIAPASYQDVAASNVAFSAHLGGYAFGFAVSLALLAIRVLPRNQFDIVALWSRAARRQQWPHPITASPTMRGPRSVVVEELGSRPLEPVELTPVERLREEVAARLAARDPRGAVAAYRQLLDLDRNQVLAASQQIEVANHLAQDQQYTQAADAYEAFLVAYPAASDAPEVRLFLGLICSRYLGDYPRAAAHLRAALDGLQLEAQHSLAEKELKQVETRLLGLDRSSEQGPRG